MTSKKTGINRLPEKVVSFSPLSSNEMIRVCDTLEEIWGMGKKEHDFLKDPLEGLIQTILSQNTNDKNRDRAYTALIKRFPHWEEVLAAREEDVQGTIAVAGLSKVKSRYIRQTLECIKKSFGKCSLEDLKNWPCQKIRDFLEKMPGIGPKTAACVLLFQCDCPAFPVDTHVTRVSIRLGIAEKGDTTRKIEERFRSFLPQERFLEVHLNIIKHGRHVCLSRKPRCLECPLSSLCAFAKTLK